MKTAVAADEPERPRQVVVPITTTMTQAWPPPNLDWRGTSLLPPGVALTVDTSVPTTATNTVLGWQ